MRPPLNGPLEYGVRVLMMLTEAYPEQLDINQLVLLDHTVLHTAEFDGPPSIHPAQSSHAGELGVRRAGVTEGLQVMLRAGLVNVHASTGGIRYEAGDAAYSFTSSLASSYIAELRDRSHWVLEQFGTLSEQELRSRTMAIFDDRLDDDDLADSESEARTWTG